MITEDYTYSVVDSGEWGVSHIYDCKTKPTVIITSVQTAVIADTVEYGPALFLGEDMEHLSLQSTIADEGIYHHAFVHGAAALCQRAPRTALVIGGGEGCMARELLKYDTIEVIDQVDWDAELLAYFKQPAVAAVWNGGAYNDPRVRVHVEDAFTSTFWKGKRYDLILIDLCDPCAETIDDLRNLLYNLHHCRVGGGVLLMNVGPVGQPLILDVKRGHQGPPGFYVQGKHICYFYSDELLSTFRFYNENDVFTFKVDVPSFKTPWCLIGVAEKHTIGEWSKGFITKEELNELMRYGDTNAGFRSSKELKRVMEEAQRSDYPLHVGC